MVHAATLLRKRDHDAELEDALLHELPEALKLRRFVERLNASPRRFAVSVSNVPGPRRPVSVAGVPVTSMLGIAEIGLRHALRVAATSLHDRLHLGFCADPYLVPQVQTMAAATESEAAALIAAAGLITLWTPGRQSAELMTSAWRGKTFCVRTRWTSSSASRHRSSSTMSR